MTDESKHDEVNEHDEDNANHDDEDEVWMEDVVDMLVAEGRLIPTSSLASTKYPPRPRQRIVR